MSEPFTDVTNGLCLSLQVVNEIYKGAAERMLTRRNAIGFYEYVGCPQVWDYNYELESAPDLMDLSDDEIHQIPIQTTQFIAGLQANVSNVCFQPFFNMTRASFLPDGMPVNTDTAYVTGLDDALTTAGLGTHFRAAKTTPHCWMDVTDPAFEFRYAEEGDILGPWIFYDMQQALSQLRYWGYEPPEGIQQNHFPATIHYGYGDGSYWDCATALENFYEAYESGPRSASEVINFYLYLLEGRYAKDTSGSEWHAIRGHRRHLIEMDLGTPELTGWPTKVKLWAETSNPQDAEFHDFDTLGLVPGEINLVYEDAEPTSASRTFEYPPSPQPTAPIYDVMPTPVCSEPETKDWHASVGNVRTLVDASFSNL
jgi:hypothetical protein